MALPPEIETLFEQHHKRVLRAAYKITGNAMDAEDVLQTVFLRLLRRESVPDLWPNPGGYLHRAAINAGLDVVRARAATRSVNFDDVGGGIPDVNVRDAALSLDDRRTAERLRRAVAGLSKRAAQMFTLRYFEGYDLREIAKLLGTSRSAVAVTLFRSRNRLRKELASFAGEAR
jgi:RNA polymerase sigma-70 factor (ECF subfamily)